MITTYYRNGVTITVETGKYLQVTWDSGDGIRKTLRQASLGNELFAHYCKALNVFMKGLGKP